MKRLKGAFRPICTIPAMQKPVRIKKERHPEMTHEEEQKAIIRAKRWINDVMYTHQDVLNGEEPDETVKATLEECEVILNALEKQTPKKPINTVVEFGSSWKMGTCPVCKRLLHSFENNVGCPKCLTLIDWSDEE